MYSAYRADTFEDLRRFLNRLNTAGDKIVAVTQGGSYYTVVYQLCGSR